MRNSTRLQSVASATWHSQLRQLLNTRRQQGLWRQPKLVGADCLDFSSNDYLGLAREPAVLRAYQQGLVKYGTGSNGSPLVSGYQLPHKRLSEALAEWLGYEAVLLTSSGYAANQAVAAALQPLQPHYYFDKRNHASMYDAVYASTLHAKPAFTRFRHNDMQHLSQLLERRTLDTEQTLVIASEGIFSMGGDAAPLAQLAELKKRYPNAVIWLDDAHGLGVTGTQGAGVRSLSGGDQVDILSASFGKAFGLGGGFVASSAAVIEAAWQQARHYIYSTSFSAAQACALHAALSLIQGKGAANTSIHAQLVDNIGHFVAGLVERGWRSAANADQCLHPIQPVVVGDIKQALRLAKHLATQRIHCVAIRPPTVPLNQTGLRVTIRANHSRQDIDRLLNGLGDAEYWGVYG